MQSRVTPESRHRGEDSSTPVGGYVEQQAIDNMEIIMREHFVLARRFAYLLASTLILAGPVWAQQTGDQNTSITSSGEAPKESVGDSEASPGFAGDDSAKPDTKLESADEVWRLWNLPPATGDVGIESIIGTDDRTRNMVTTTYPERTITLVTFDGGRCSGAMIGPNTVLTAGHCVHSGGSAGGWRTNVRVYPGRNGAQSPFGSCGARNLYSVYGWVRDRDERYDYGAIKLDCTVGNTTGWLGFWWQAASLVGLRAIIDGYPGDKPLEQWRATDSVRVNDDLQIFYQNDTIPGSSGSSVYSTQSSFCTGPCVMGIHAYGVHGAPPHSNHNHGVRITKPVYENLLAWRNAP